VKASALFVAGLCLASAARADDAARPEPPVVQDGGDVVPIVGAAAAPAPAVTHVPKRLRLGPWGYESYESGPPVVVDPNIPRFETEVEVRAKAMDPIALTAKLQWWFRDSSLTHGAVPATSTAPSLQEIKDYRPAPPDAVDLVPVIQWLTEKLNKKK
jgi:hypothetical protein